MKYISAILVKMCVVSSLFLLEIEFEDGIPKFKTPTAQAFCIGSGSFSHYTLTCYRNPHFRTASGAVWFVGNSASRGTWDQGEDWFKADPKDDAHLQNDKENIGEDVRTGEISPLEACRLTAEAEARACRRGHYIAAGVIGTGCSIVTFESGVGPIGCAALVNIQLQNGLEECNLGESAAKARCD